MILSDRSIKKAVEMGCLKITPIEADNIQPASVDLTLMDEFYLFNKTGLIDPKRSSTHTAPPNSRRQPYHRTRRFHTWFDTRNSGATIVACRPGRR